MVFGPNGGDGTVGTIDPNHLDAWGSPGTLGNPQQSWLEPAVFAGLQEALGKFSANDVSELDYPLRDRQKLEQIARWRERVADYSPYNDIFSVQQQESGLVVDVPFDNRYLFLPYTVGTAWVEGDKLKRLNPLQHPYFGWLRAARVAYIGVGYTGSKSTNYRTNKQVARYKLARFTIGFAGYPMVFRSDSEITRPEDEATRNTYWEMQPSSQMLAAEGGASLIKYIYSVPGGPQNKDPFRAPMGTIVNQIAYRLIWKWIPWDYLMKGMVPANLYAAQGKVNLLDFLGFPAGTLRFDPPAITVYPNPVRTAGTPSLLCDVVLNLSYFDPPQGILTGPGSEVRGHNLIPHRISNLWFPGGRPDATGNVSPSSKMLYDSTDFSFVFRKPT